MSKKTKILIVDDNKNDLLLLDTLLRESGYEVVSVENGVEALERLGKNSVGMIISDILMPRMDGFQFCRECKKDVRLVRIPFVFYTSAYTEKKDEEFALNLGAEKFLVKPLEPDAFLDTLKTVIEDCRNALPVTPKTSIEDEEIYLAEYNKRLVKQLEEKVLELEKEMDIRRQAERRLSAQYYVTQVLVESVTIKEASPKILQAVCMALEWDLGEIWVYDRQDCVLRCSEIWHIPSIEVSEFKKVTKQITFSKGIGLPGRVFSSAKPVWAADVVHDTTFLRAAVADKEGLHGAFGFPILSGSDVLGTICFFSHEIRQPDEDLLNMLTAIGTQIGLFIKRKHAEEQIKTSLKEKETLLMEIHHRVRNNLQVISSLFLLHRKYLKDEQSAKIFKEAQNRIQSMAIIHEILYESNYLSRIDFSQFVRTLTEKLFSSYGIDSGKISLETNIKDVSLKIEQAVPLGLIVNELFSNSLEHAFPFDKIRVGSFDSDQVRPEGKQEEHEIRISLTLDPDNKIKLIVCDNGVGVPKDMDFRTTDSLGLNLVKIIAEDQLKGTIELNRNNGTEFKITFEV
ncbi:MAG: histidine kinase dimerization/phosphoacceptor domain -containing protein [Candidatus Scalindua sp.]